GERLPDPVQFQGALPGFFLVAGGEGRLDSRLENESLPFPGDDALAHRLQVAPGTDEGCVVLLEFFAEALCFVVQPPSRVVVEDVSPQSVDPALLFVKKLLQAHHLPPRPSCMRGSIMPLLVPIWLFGFRPPPFAVRRKKPATVTSERPGSSLRSIPI